MKTYDVALSNDSCVFDSGKFTSPESIMEWASRRGGRYVLQVGVVGGKDCPASFSTYNGRKWARYTPWDGWNDLTKKEVVEMISQMQ